MGETCNIIWILFLFLQCTGIFLFLFFKNWFQKKFQLKLGLMRLMFPMLCIQIPFPPLKEREKDLRGAGGSEQALHTNQIPFPNIVVVPSREEII
jgi:hypothetical protein